MIEKFSFTIEDHYVRLRFICPNHKRRIEQILSNLQFNDEKTEHNAQGDDVKLKLNDDDIRIKTKYNAQGDDVKLKINGITIDEFKPYKAVFFENTEYSVNARGKSGAKISEITLLINNRQYSDRDEKSTISSDGDELFGSLNFHNQVGETDIKLVYKLNDENITRSFSLTTEVLSYKLDYRSDLRTIISDIEQEYAMLSMSFLKDTYLSMKEGRGESKDIIWWQIFKSCYNDIIDAAKNIIDRPKRRLRTVVRYERAERLATLPRDMENEYLENKDNPAYLYRTEDMVLSHDTVENRFLKHALKEMARRFVIVKEHIMTAMRLENPDKIDINLKDMEDNLVRLSNHSFFRGVGVFKGFRQDSLVMKQAHGYKTILEKWIVLQQGYELEEGMRKLEVKDISELYEIWCFIKVKNIVQQVLNELHIEATQKTNGKYVSKDFIPKLLYGGSMSFFDSKNIELASVVYNAQVEKEEYSKESAIDFTNSLTTTQRPDIVLQLSKQHDGGIKYTYLFDAKYRINDKEIGGYQVPPEDAINQMHRYRDAIYYTGENKDNDDIKKEVIAGYVLFPGNVPSKAFEKGSENPYWFQRSNSKIGIGAFPLRPDKKTYNENGEIKVDPSSSEKALYEQIKEWLQAEDMSDKLLESMIPQKGLEYTNEPVVKGCYFLSTIDTHVNADAEAIVNGTASLFLSGYNTIFAGIDFQKIKYFAPVENHIVKGYYRVTKVELKSMDDHLLKLSEKLKDSYKGYEKPIRVMLRIADYKTLETPFVYGIRDAFTGVNITKNKFLEYCRNAKEQNG